MKKIQNNRIPVSFLKEAEWVEIRRSDRRTLSVEITVRGEVRVRAPKRLPERTILDFLFRRKDWIDTHIAVVRKRMESAQNEAGASGSETYTPEQLKDLRRRAAADLKQRVTAWAPRVGVTYGTISIRTQRSRWGSCSAKGNISLNALLIELPEELRDYTVVHELCHRKQMNHSAAFWAEVARVLPDYRSLRKQLKEQGSAVIARLP